MPWEVIGKPVEGNATLKEFVGPDEKAPKEAKIERKNLSGWALYVTNGNVTREISRVLSQRRHSASPHTTFKAALDQERSTAQVIADEANRQENDAVAKVQAAARARAEAEATLDQRRREYDEAVGARNRLIIEVERSVQTREQRLSA